MQVVQVGELQVSICNVFQLEETAPVHRRPKHFGVQLRAKEDSPYHLLSSEVLFDEIDGMSHEERMRVGMKKQKRVQREIARRVLLRTATRVALKQPSYFLRKHLTAPYSTYDLYLSL